MEAMNMKHKNEHKCVLLFICLCVCLYGVVFDEHKLSIPKVPRNNIRVLNLDKTKKKKLIS